MPSHRAHRAVNRAVLGRDCEIVNLLKDAPYEIWPGPEHRKYFHDDATNFFIGALFGPEAWLAGELHDWLDRNYTEKDGKLVRKRKKDPLLDIILKLL